MKKLLPFAIALALFCGCGTMQTRRMDAGEDVTYRCVPSVLEARASSIETELKISFPKGYFKPSSMMVITPVLVYEGGQSTGEAVVLQGTDVRANYRVISQDGGTVSCRMSFEYRDGMQQSYLEVRPVLVFGLRKVSLPAVKVAQGCITTYMLAETGGACEYKSSGYKPVEQMSTEVELRYNVNSSETSGWRNEGILRDAEEYLAEVQADPKSKLKGAQIIAYASPEGGEKFNYALSEDRAGSALNAWSRMSGSGDGVSIMSMGQDWEGLREALEESDIPDKDLLLRILMMYPDPGQREAEMRNLTHLYRELGREVFPDLRRASIVVNTERVNYTLDELQEMSRDQLFRLTEQELIELANNTEQKDKRSLYYRLAAERFGSDRGWYNLGVLCLESGAVSAAESYLGRVPQDPDVLNVRGVIQMRAGRMDEALELFGQSGTAAAKQNVGTIYMMRGEYAAAADELAGTGCFNEALAGVLAGRDVPIRGTGCREEYLRAVVAARIGDAKGVREHLGNACKDPELAARAAKDMEFSAYR